MESEAADGARRGRPPWRAGRPPYPRPLNSRTIHDPQRPRNLRPGGAGDDLSLPAFAGQPAGKRRAGAFLRPLELRLRSAALRRSEFLIFRHIPGTVVDPKAFNPKNLEKAALHEDASGRYFIMPARSYGLGVAVEQLHLPVDVTAICVGKSTYARCGIIANVTPAEAGWRGHLTLEFSNSSAADCRIYADEGAVQMLFFRGKPCRRVPDPPREIPEPAPPDHAAGGVAGGLRRTAKSGTLPMRRRDQAELKCLERIRAQGDQQPNLFSIGVMRPTKRIALSPPQGRTRRTGRTGFLWMSKAPLPGSVARR